MSIDSISKEVDKIKKKYDEVDPVKLCQSMKISLMYQPMGLFDHACKGFYMEQSRKQAIVINSQLDEVLHRKVLGVKSFHDFSLFDETSLYEYQANIFAADFLLTDEDVLRVLNEDMSFFTAASTLCVPAELLDFKFRILKKKAIRQLTHHLMLILIF